MTTLRNVLVLLALTSLLSVWAQAPDGATYTTATYTVERGDTLYRIAQSFGVSVDELVRLNGLADPNQIEVGQTLLVPGALTTPDLSAGLSTLTLTPEVARQGRVVTLAVTGAAPLDLTATLLGIDYPLAPTATGAVGVLAVPALQEPGVYTLTLTGNAGGEPTEVRWPMRVAAGGYGRESITIPPSSSNLLDPELVQQELEYVRSHCLTLSPVRRWSAPFRMPVETPVTTSAYGTRRSYNGGPFSSYHGGLDLRGNAQTPVYAAADGVVSIAEPLQVRGNAVYLQHGWGVCSGYLHMDRLTVEAGAAVSAGDLLGYVGATGLVTGPHLHWEVRVRGVPVDPLQWVEAGIGVP